jgi:hypothetical protein
MIATQTIVAGLAGNVMMHSNSIAPRIALHVCSHCINFTSYFVSEDGWGHSHAMKFF